MENTQTSSGYQLNLKIVKNTFEQIREMVEGQMRGAALELVHGLFREEVERLCGATYSRKSKELMHRGGSDPGSILLRGQRIEVRKPRVKQDGTEVHLESYGALQSYDILCEKVMKHMIAGVSTRDYEGLLDEVSGGLGLSKSSVSKAFIKGSKEALDEINSRPLGEYNFITIMVDGIDFSDRMIIVSTGITTSGKKITLGLLEGDTENWEVCKDLFQNLISRGLKTDTKYLFVIDGSKALKKAIRKVFGDEAPIQRCVRHKERNIIGYLAEHYHREFRRRWKALHGCANIGDAEREYEKLLQWLRGINHAAASSLEEAEKETLTVIKLRVPGLLRLSLLSTNPIESIFSLVAYKSGRIKNWGSGENQRSRWAAAALLESEKRTHKVRGFREIPVLLSRLSSLNIENKTQVA